MKTLVDGADPRTPSIKRSHIERSINKQVGICQERRNSGITRSSQFFQHIAGKSHDCLPPRLDKASKVRQTYRLLKRLSSE